MGAIIINAIISHLVPFLEEEFVKHEPEIQDALIKDSRALAIKIEAWAKSKLQQRGH
jgi:hypothetical protein